MITYQGKQSSITWLLALALGALVSGCQTYKQQNTIITNYRQGNMALAEKEAALKADKEAKSKDALIWRLEHATVLRAAGKYEESLKAFDQAEEIFNKYAESAKVKVAREAGAMFVNQAALDYQGRAYDGIMLNTYKALDYLQLNQPDKARVEIIRAYQRQQDAVEDNKKRIEKTQEEVEKQKEKEKQAMEKARQNERFKTQMSTNFANLENLQPYADYVNPFTVYLDGLFFMANSTGGSDLERARKSFERVSGFLGDNKHIKADLEAVDGLIQGKELAPATYVIFETGLAPIRDQIRIDIPIILLAVVGARPNLSYVGAAFPRLQFQGDYTPSLTVTGSGTSETTSLLASMDSVIGHDFKNELPTIITKTMAATITKAVSAYFINKAVSQQSSIAGLFSKIATAAAQAAVNIADLRTWTTLPKEFQFCRFPTPADRKIDLEAPNGRQKVSVTIPEGAINIIHVKSITANSPLSVSQIKLK